MRARDKALKSKWGTICTPLQMLAPDGKMRKTQAANTEGILRIIQSIPSPKAEPFKTLLAKVGAERLEEIADQYSYHRMVIFMVIFRKSVPIAVKIIAAFIFDVYRPCEK